MRILHYINNLGSGGAEKLLTDILPLMKERGHEVTLVISNSKMNVEKYAEILNRFNIKIVNLNTSFYNPYQIFLLIKMIKKGNYDIVHSHLFPSQYWLALASFFLHKSVVYIKTEHSSFNKRRNYSILKPIERLIYSRYNTTIAISVNVKNNLKTWLKSSSKIKVIENGINLTEIQNRVDLKKKVFPCKIKSILMVGRFDGYIKDHSTLIKAIKRLPDYVHLYLAGEGPNKSKVQDEVQLLKLGKRVHFLGLRNDIYDLMYHADLNVLSTRYEGLSGVTLESLASKKPFLGSNVEGVKEIVPNSSFLFTAGSDTELANKIFEILENKSLRDQMIFESNEHIKKYDIMKMINKYIQTYKTELNRY